jgi:hypothetical protein
MTKHRTGDNESSATSGKMKTAPQELTKRTMTDFMRDEPSAPAVVDRGTFQAQLDALRVREKAHTREGDAIAAARRRLPMVEVDGATPLIGERGAVTLLDVFEGRRMLIAYYFMWYPGAGAVRGVHLLYIAGPRAVQYSCTRRHLRHVLPRSVRRECPVPRLHGLEDALVLGSPGLARNALGRTPSGYDAHRLLPAPRIQCLRDLLDDDARRRSDGQQLPAARPDRLRAAGDVGGFADWLATMVGRQAAYACRWTSHRPVVSPKAGRSDDLRHWQPLTSFLHHSDWHLCALSCSLPRRNSHANAMR